MERHEVLRAVRAGKFPPDFSQKLGKPANAIERCLKGMLCPVEEDRFSCKSVRRHLEEICASLAQEGELE